VAAEEPIRLVEFAGQLVHAVGEAAMVLNVPAAQIAKADPAPV
jgi:hypothetical protein